MLFIKRNASTILTCVGGAGVVVTTVMAVKATPKAIMLLEEAETEKGEELTRFEKFQVAGPVYIPTALVAFGTMGCIFGANMFNKRQQASLTSAYVLLEQSYKEYRSKVTDIYGEEADHNVKNEIAKDKYEEIDVSKDEDLFYDEYSKRYFTSTRFKVQNATFQLNRDLFKRDYATLNDYYEYIGLETVPGGDAIGWTRGGNFDMYWQDWIDFSIGKIPIEDGVEAYSVVMLMEPYIDFEDY